jgi:2,3-dihydroxyphenylpropionate 1,2-dioxygenase
MAEPEVVDEYYAAYDEMRVALEAAKPDALIVIAAEHFANFFMNNMPAYCMGMGEEYEGPIEDPEWLGIPRTKIPGCPELSERIIKSVMNDVDVAYAQEWKFDHGISVPLNFLTPKYDLLLFQSTLIARGRR